MARRTSTSSFRIVLAALGAAVVATFGLVGSSASADPPTKTDVMFLFDTSSSMEKVLTEASAEVEEAIQQIDSQFVDVRLGLAEVRDYGGSVYDPKDPGNVPWRLDVALTSSRESVVSGMAGLQASGGGDHAEAYGRALWETANNPTVGWRPDAARVIILVADDFPHDNDLDVGIAEGDQIEPAPWDTGEELHEGAGVAGTTLGPDTNLDWQAILQELAATGVKLDVIAYHGDTGSLVYWEHWAALTGGQAVLGEKGDFASKLAGLVEAGAARACTPVRGGTGRLLLASLRCPGALLPLTKICSAKLSIAEPLKKLSSRKVLVGRGALARLLKAVRGAGYRHGAPHGFSNAGQVTLRLEQGRTAIKLIRVLLHLSKAVRQPSFDRVAAAIANVGGAKACAAGLIAAVK